MSDLRYTQLSEALAPQCGALELLVFPHALPEDLISDFGALPPERREQVRDYVEELALRSDHFAMQLGTAPPRAACEEQDEDPRLSQPQQS